MNYEDKYKEALGWMQGLYGGLHGKTKEEAEHYFPELKESEDERIKREILELVSIAGNGNQFEEIKDWLEKQKPIEDIVAKYKNSWYREGKIDGKFEGLSDDEKYQQGWHDALEKQNRKLDADKVIDWLDALCHNPTVIEQFKKDFGL